MVAVGPGGEDQAEVVGAETAQGNNFFDVINDGAKLGGALSSRVWRSFRANFADGKFELDSQAGLGGAVGVVFAFGGVPTVERVHFFVEGGEFIVVSEAVARTQTAFDGGFLERYKQTRRILEIMIEET